VFTVCRGVGGCRKQEIHPSSIEGKKKGGRKSSLDLFERKKELEFSVCHGIKKVSQDTGEARMAKLLTPYLFTWREVEARSDLERLRLVLDHLPDEGLMRKLEEHRKWGRDDYPIRPVWNSVLGGIVYQHASVDSLRRELSRNGELRDQCGFDPKKGSGAVPPSWVYTRFLKLLFEFKSEIDTMFDRLVDELKGLLPDLGFSVAVDSKGVDSAGRPTKEKKRDGRRDRDADWGKKTYHGQREDGTLWEKVVTWFGYKIHLLVDTTYEMPISYQVTRASASDTKHLLPLVEEVKKKHVEIYKDMDRMTADKGYDSEENCRRLYDEHGIKPVIDIRRMWRDKETKLLDPNRSDNIVYDEVGRVYCICPKTEEQRGMAYGGLEKDRMTLKYVCPMKAYGLTCQGSEQCGHAMKSERVSMEIDRRIFTPVARSSYAWERGYKKRTAVERVNSRLDVSFGFEKHFIRGQKKMEMRVGLALCVMLAMAVGRIKEKHQELMRSLVKSPWPLDQAA
jgi:hypothetical protein